MARVMTGRQLSDFRTDEFITPLDCLTPEKAAACMRKIEECEEATGEDVSEKIRARAVLAFKWLLDLARHPRIAGALQDAIGPNVILMFSGVWSKAPGGPNTGVLIAGENNPGHWVLNKEPTFDLDPVGMAELDAFKKAYYDTDKMKLATETVA